MRQLSYDVALGRGEEAPRHSVPIPLSRWARDIGRTTSTIWRWRKLGWLEVVNIAGKLYVTDEAIGRFNQRAAAGEFSKVPVIPLRTKETQ